MKENAFRNNVQEDVPNESNSLTLKRNFDIIGYEVKLYVNKIRYVENYNLISLCNSNIIWQKVSA